MKYQDVYSKYDCQLNKIDINKIFSFYERVKFIYPEKAKTLKPYWDEILSNWQKAFTYGDELIRVVTHTKSTDEWGTITNWRHSDNGWTAQHLVSNSPYASRAVMLAEQHAAIEQHDHQSYQNWFQRCKRLPNRVFGSIIKSLGRNNCSVKYYDYMTLPFDVTKHRYSTGLYIDKGNQNDIHTLAVACRGEVYANTELCNNFNYVNTIYQKAGLSRYQIVLTAKHVSQNKPIGALVAFRGPLGINFSFVENRIDLLVDPSIQGPMRSNIISELLYNVVEFYKDFSPKALFLVCDKTDAQIVEQLGGRLLREYAQCIWTKNGYLDWYQHVDTLYERVKLRTLRFSTTGTPLYERPVFNGRRA